MDTDELWRARSRVTVVEREVTVGKVFAFDRRHPRRERAAIANTRQRGWTTTSTRRKRRTAHGPSRRPLLQVFCSRRRGIAGGQGGEALLLRQPEVDWLKSRSP